jgi:protein tyrosine phosphatase
MSKIILLISICFVVCETCNLECSIGKLEKIISGGKIDKIFYNVPRYLDSTIESELQKNVERNRYTDILAYDKTRVLLPTTAENRYINANYVNMKISENREQKWIAAQVKCYTILIVEVVPSDEYSCVG